MYEYYMESQLTSSQCYFRAIQWFIWELYSI